MAKSQRGKGTGSLIRKTPKGPWIAKYYDLGGTRREHSTRTTDRAAATRILDKFIADLALRRDLVIDPKADRFAIDGRKPLFEHVATYLAHCERIGLDAEHVASKRNHLRRLGEVAGITAFNQLTADTLEQYLAEIKDSGRSARSVNFARQIVLAFYGWCVKTGRAAVNPLKVVGKQDETRDRRRVRRPLTDDELTRLLAVGRERGRDAWYLAAAFAGLRRGDLRTLTWADVNFDSRTITIRGGKAKREDVLPMHSQLADALQRHYEAFPAMPKARVWSEAVTNRTRQADFVRAGIARVVPVLDAEGKPVIVGEGNDAKPKTRISFEDDEGRVIDLHALRTTLGTQLARAGVTPQVAQRIMRHSDYRTTLKHYTVLGLNDTSAAMDRLPDIARRQQVQTATGTTDSVPMQAQALPNACHPLCHQLERETVRNGANQRGETTIRNGARKNQKPQHSLGISGVSADFFAVERKRLELSTPSLQS